MIRIRSLLLAAFCALVLIPGGAASAGTLVVSVDATFGNIFGDFVGNITPAGSLTGTVTLDDAVVGTFTPSPNPTFVRAEMLYSGAILSTNLTLDGNPVSGTGGDLRIRDAATGGLAGDDKYELLVVLDTGTVGTATPVSIDLNGAYGDSAITLTGTDPLFAPPPFDATKTSNFMLVSTTGGSAFGDISALAGPAPPALVPLTTPLTIGVLVTILVGAARRAVVPR